MFKKIIISLVLLIGLTAPLAVFAGAGDQATFPIIHPREIDLNVATVINAIFNIIWPVIVAIIIISFIWAGITFLTAQGDATKISQARKAVLWGIVGVVVIVLSVSIITFVNTLFPAPESPPAQAGADCTQDSDCASGVCLPSPQGDFCAP